MMRLDFLPPPRQLYHTLRRFTAIEAILFGGSDFRVYPRWLENHDLATVKDGQGSSYQLVVGEAAQGLIVGVAHGASHEFSAADLRRVLPTQLHSWMKTPELYSDEVTVLAWTDDAGLWTSGELVDSRDSGRYLEKARDLFENLTMTDDEQRAWVEENYEQYVPADLWADLMTCTRSIDLWRPDLPRWSVWSCAPLLRAIGYNLTPHS